MPYGPRRAKKASSRAAPRLKRTVPKKAKKAKKAGASRTFVAKKARSAPPPKRSGSRRTGEPLTAMRGPSKAKLSGMAKAKKARTSIPAGYAKAQRRKAGAATAGGPHSARFEAAQRRESAALKKSMAKRRR